MESTLKRVEMIVQNSFWIYVKLKSWQPRAGLRESGTDYAQKRFQISGERWNPILKDAI